MEFIGLNMQARSCAIGVAIGRYKDQRCQIELCEQFDLTDGSQQDERDEPGKKAALRSGIAECPSPDVENHDDRRYRGDQYSDESQLDTDFQPEIMKMKPGVAVDVEHLPKAYRFRIARHPERLKPDTAPRVI